MPTAFENNIKLTEVLISFSQRPIRSKRFEEFRILLRFAMSGSREILVCGTAKAGPRPGWSRGESKPRAGGSSCVPFGLLRVQPVGFLLLATLPDG